jgi:hypothetical protein
MSVDNQTAPTGNFGLASVAFPSHYDNFALISLLDCDIAPLMLAQMMSLAFDTATGFVLSMAMVNWLLLVAL